VLEQEQAEDKEIPVVSISWSTLPSQNPTDSETAAFTVILPQRKPFLSFKETKKASRSPSDNVVTRSPKGILPSKILQPSVPSKKLISF
jgi:hypothetical protein